MQTVRAEIKKWEKSFKAKHDRDPTVDDIKAQQDIADKYRLYKRLSKQAAATASAPKTPPKAPVLLPSSSRAAEATAPLAIFNPFSPVKNKGKNRADQALARPIATPQNPFSTPSKSSSKSVRSASPCEPSTSRQPDASAYPAAPSTALTRARKRLRGEPVSPSPNKEKRQRVLPISTSSSELSEVDDDPFHADMNDVKTITIGDSPVKPPAGNKSFTTLFQESLPPLVLEPRKIDNGSIAPGKDSIAHRHPSVVNNLPSFDEELVWPKANRVQTKTNQRKLNLKSNKGEAVKKASTTVAEKEDNVHIPLKRPLLDAEPDSMKTQPRPGAQLLTLVPPSPPPETTEPAPSTSNQSRQKRPLMTNSRKKVKFSNSSSSGEETEEEMGDPEPTIKIIDATFQRFKNQRNNEWNENLESDPDPILTYAVRSKAQGSPPGIHPLLDDSCIIPHDTEEEGKVEVDLPEKLRDVLALDMLDSKARDRHEERVVDTLLYNRRTFHYDPSKGGEIWDVGEDLHTTRIRWDGELEVLPDTDGDGEWEGEPVPWEVAEL